MTFINEKEPVPIKKVMRRNFSFSMDKSLSRLNFDKFEFFSDAGHLQLSGSDMIGGSGIKSQYDKITYMRVVCNRRAFFAMGAIIMSLNLFTFTDTILADHLQLVFGLSSSIVSLFYASNTIGFLITTLFAHKLVEKFECMSIMLVTLIIQFIAVLITGPTQILPNKTWIIVFGLVTTGMALPFTIIPAY